MAIKKLIEVALPLEAINSESAREKSIRHGHPSTLHLWWARRPLAAARAVIWSSLVDDPSSHPELFPTEEEQSRERQRLFSILEKLVKWENTNNKEILAEAKAEIMKSTNGNPPALLDPFAGGGAIPLEAQRLGLEAHASDLNPVAVMINKAMIEIPPLFAGLAPVNPDARASIGANEEWSGPQGLAKDVRYYGEWMKKEAIRRIGHLYPKATDAHGQVHTVIAWIWARTVKCPNPACGCEMPLANSFELSKKKGKEAYIQPIIEGTNIRYEVKYGKNAPQPPKTARGKFKCICCGEPVRGDYIKAEGKAKRIGNVLMAIIGDSTNGRVYITPTADQTRAADCPKPDSIPDAILNGKAADQLPLYGYITFSELYTNRQLMALSTFSDLVAEAQQKVECDGGSPEYAKAVSVYLAFSVDKLSDTNSKCVSWNITRDGLRNTFARQAIAMTWDFAEGNPLGDSSGCFSNALDWIEKSIIGLPATSTGIAWQHDAQTNNNLRDIMVSTDPPYYDNICYADLSDYFYMWLRGTLKSVYPDLFKTMQVPKNEELIASPYRFECGFQEAKEFLKAECYRRSDKFIYTLALIYL